MQHQCHFKWRTFLSSHGTYDCIFIKSCLQIRAGECIYWNFPNVCWDWNTSSYLAINKWWCCEMFPDHSGGKGLKRWMAAVREWIEPRDSPSGLGAQPPVTPLQPQQEIIQFHPRAIGRSPVWWSILWASRENRSYLEAPSPGTFVPLNHSADSGHTEALGWDSGHYAPLQHQ